MTAQHSQILLKHSGAIHITNKLSATQRKAYNVMLFHALPLLPDFSVLCHEYPLCQLMRDCGFRSSNTEHFKDAIKGIMSQTVTWNIFRKDRDSAKEWWTISGLLADVEISDGRCRWSYSPSLRRLLSHPSVYAKLNLREQADLRGRHTIPLWEYFWDALGSKRSQCEVELELSDLRRLLSLGETDYAQYKFFNRDVLSRAVKEISKGTQLHIEYTPRRSGRKVDRIRFTIKRKDRLSSAASLSQNRPSSGSVAHRLEEEFSVKSAVAKRLINDHSEQELSDAMDYVQARYEKGMVSGSPAGYLIGVLNNGFSSPSSEDSPMSSKQHSLESTRQLEQLFHQHRSRRAREEYANLSVADCEELKESFIKTLSPADRVELDACGFDESDHIQRMFSVYLAKRLLNDLNTEDVSFDIFAEKHGYSSLVKTN